MLLSLPIECCSPSSTLHRMIALPLKSHVSFLALVFPPSCRQINLTGQRSVSFGIVGRATAGLPPQPDVKPRTVRKRSHSAACIKFLIANECTKQNITKGSILILTGPVISPRESDSADDFEMFDINFSKRATH